MSHQVLLPMSLVMQQGPYPNQRFPLHKNVLIIGRASSNDIVIDDVTISGQHARLTRRRSHWVVEDLGSSNGTFVDGRRVGGPVILTPGRQLALGPGIIFGVQAGAAATWPAAIAAAPARAGGTLRRGLLGAVIVLAILVLVSVASVQARGLSTAGAHGDPVYVELWLGAYALSTPAASPEATVSYDLYVRRMDFSTDTPAVGEPVQLFVMIATDTYPSQGPYFPASAFRWRKGPAYPWQEEECPANTRYANCIKTLEFSYDQPGSYRVQVEADSRQQVAEADEGNNTKTWTVNVGQVDTDILPTLTPVVDIAATMPPVSDYDLYVRRMDFSTDKPMVGEKVRLFIMLATDSYPAAGPYFPAVTFRWRQGDGSAWHEEKCPANERYASCVAAVELQYALPGTYVVEVEVDTPNSIVEKDESNNTRRWTVTVGLAPTITPPPTPMPTAAPPLTPTPEPEYDIRVKRMDIRPGNPSVDDTIQMFILVVADTYPPQGPYFPASAFRWRQGPEFPWQEVNCPANVHYGSCEKTVQFTYDQPGDYFLEVEADSRSEVPETNEVNNSRSWTLTVRGVAPPAPTQAPPPAPTGAPPK